MNAQAHTRDLALALAGVGDSFGELTSALADLARAVGVVAVDVASVYGVHTWGVPVTATLVALAVYRAVRHDVQARQVRRWNQCVTNRRLGLNR